MQPFEHPDEPDGSSSFSPWLALFVALVAAVVLGVVALLIVRRSSANQPEAKGISVTTILSAGTAAPSTVVAAIASTSTVVSATASTSVAISLPDTTLTTLAAPELKTSLAVAAETTVPAAATGNRVESSSTATGPATSVASTAPATVGAGPTSSTKPVAFIGPLSKDPAAVAIVAAYTAKAEGRLDDFFALLHPAERAKISIKVFKKCYAPTADDRNSVVEVFGLGDAEFTHALIPERKAKVVGLRFKSGTQSVERELYMINSVQDHGWRWVLSAEQVAELSDGRCA